MKTNHARTPSFIMAGIVLVLVAVGVYEIVRPDEFSSQAVIKIQTHDSPGFSDTDPRSFDEDIVSMEVEVIVSESILSNVVHRLDLVQKWSKPYINRHALQVSDAAGILRGRLTVTPRKNTSLIGINALSEDADEAALIANTVAEAYQDWRIEQGRRLAQGGITALRGQIEIEEGKIHTLSNKVIQLAKDLHVPDSELNRTPPQMSFGDPDPSNLRFVDAAISEARIKHKRMEEQIQKLMALSPVELRQTLPSFNPDPNLATACAELEAVTEQLIRNETNTLVTPESLRAKIAVLKKSADDQVGVIMESFNRAVSESKVELEQLNKVAEEKGRERQTKLNERRPLWEAKRQLEDTVDLRDLITRKMNIEEADLRLPHQSQVIIIERAVPSKTSVRHHRPLGAALTLMGLALFGYGLASLWKTRPLSRHDSPA